MAGLANLGTCLTLKGMNFEDKVNQLKSALSIREESDEPEQILQVIRDHDGTKGFTKRLLSKLPGGEARWRISKHAGMSHLETVDYRRSGGREGYSYLVSYDTVNVVLNAAEFEERNPMYFRGRRERMAERAKRTEAQLAELRFCIDTVVKAKKALAAVEAQLSELIGYDGPFSADSHLVTDMIEEESKCDS